MEDDLSNVRMNSDHVTCPKCLSSINDSAPVLAVEAKAQPDPKINQILRERRAMLSRVRADLDKVGELQAQFQRENGKAENERGSAQTGK
jgi:hypothetical protein